MALEAVNFQQDWLGYNSKDQWGYDFGLEKQELFKSNPEYSLGKTSSETNDYFVHGDWVVSSSPTTSMAAAQPPHFGDHHHQLHQHQCPNSSMDAANYVNGSFSSALDSSTTTCTRPRRRRSKTQKNKQEIENQRMTHIAVERNRRKQMNEYLSVLRSLMPQSYVQRGDQASIIAGAINYVRELEHRLQGLTAEKEAEERSDINGGNSISSSSSSPFAEFFKFPQYSTGSTLGDDDHNKDSLISRNDQSMVVENQSALDAIEVTMVERHANLKIRSKRRPAQLLKVVSGLNSLCLSVLHLNVTTLHQTVLYSLSVKVEDDCKLTSVDDIATAVNQLLGRIQEDHMLYMLN